MKQRLKYLVQGIKNKARMTTAQIVFVIVMVTGGALFLTGGSTFAEKPIKVSETYETKNGGYELSIINDDIANYGYISSTVQKRIISAIQETSEREKLPVGLLHAIMKIESEYRFSVIHPTVTVSVKGKSVTTNGIGLGGILWVYWGDSLKAHKIAETEMDLYLPEVNVAAVGYVLRYLINDELKKNSLLNQSNILDNVIRRYYGAFSQDYVNKMERNLAGLWMKRISKDLIKV